MDILFICHRIPFPADKGDKIVTNNILRFFSARYRVHLATFIDDPADEKHRDVVGQLCASSWIGSISKATKVKRALLGLIRGEPLTASIYADEALKKWISETVKKHGIRHILVYSSGAARSLPSAIVNDPNNRLVVDFCDVDSHKWQQYARTHRPPMKWIYAREARKLVAYDRMHKIRSGRIFRACARSNQQA
jgi:polysaccharide biosynthesis protein PslH